MNFKNLKNQKHIIILIGILGLSFFVNFFMIGNLGTGNSYYAACVKSMTQNLHNFFFISFDPAGMLSVDKSPLGLWVQAIFCLLFGYNGYSILLPQIISGTISTLMLYIIGSKFFNKKVGLISAFLFCLTPIVVAVSRNNTMDMQLILVLLIAVFFVLKSIQTNKWRWLIIAGALLGLGFNIKMLQAYLIVPSIIVAYLIFARQKIWKRFAAGILSCLVMIAVSGAWIAAVTLTPAENRPYVDSTTNNSIVELIFGHNGTDRLFGDGTSLNNGRENNSKQSPTNNNNIPQSNQDQNSSNSNNNNSYDKTNYESNSYLNSSDPDSPPNSQPMGGGHTREIGTASMFRLWNNSLFGQASWLLIFALVSLVVCLRKKSLINKNISQCVLVLFGCWVITAGLFFSFAGFFHAYYLAMLAPPIAMLSAIGINYIYERLTKKEKSKKIDKKLIILILGLIIDVIISIIYLINYNQFIWIIPITIALLISGIILLIISLKKHLIKHKNLMAILTSIVLLSSMVFAPSCWSLYTTLNSNNSALPSAGPSQMNGNRPPNERNESDELLNYLLENYKEGSFLITACRTQSISNYIIKTGLPCFSYGGFMGKNTFTVERLQQLVNEGKITYFLLSNEDSDGDIESYVKNNAIRLDILDDKSDNKQKQVLYKFN